MRITVEITDAQRAALLEIAARRSEKGFSRLVQESLERYLQDEASRKDAVAATLAVGGTLQRKGRRRSARVGAKNQEHLTTMIADSDLLIDLLRGGSPGYDRIVLELRTGNLATTSINAFEQAHVEKERSKVEPLLDALKILPLDAQAAGLAARVRRDLEADGNGIGMADYLIAGVCLARENPPHAQSRPFPARAGSTHRWRLPVMRPSLW